MKNTLKFFVAACLAACALAIAIGLSGCQSSGKPHAGFSESAYGYSTNAVATLRRDLLPYVPPPYNGLLEGGLAVGTALLGLWGAKLHKNVTALNGAVKKVQDGPSPVKS